LPFQILFSSRKMAFSSSIVKANQAQVACNLFVLLPMTCCANPAMLPNGIDQFVRHSALTPGTFAIHDFDYTATTNPLLVEVPVPRAHSLGEFEVFHFPGGYVATEFGRTIARRRLEALQVSGERFDGQGNARCLGAGQLFSLIGHPEDSVNTDYLVYSVSAQTSAPASPTTSWVVASRQFPGARPKALAARTDDVGRRSPSARRIRLRPPRGRGLASVGVAVCAAAIARAWG
jgi:uncharacterized protein involved in type VI secretion and phage assembly